MVGARNNAAPALAERSGAGGHGPAVFFNAGVHDVRTAAQRLDPVRAIDRVKTLRQVDAGPRRLRAVADAGGQVAAKRAHGLLAAAWHKRGLRGL